MVRLGIALSLPILFSACGGKGGSGGGAITEIEVTPQQANLTPGQTLQFSAVAKTASGSTVEQVTFSWKSLDTSVSTIDANGVATGKTIGVTSIVAFTSAFNGSATLGVVGSAKGSTNGAVSGTAQYEDKPFDPQGFTGQLQPTAVRGAIINLIAVDGFVKLASGATGPDGAFSFSGIDNSSRRGGLYLQLLSKTESSNPTQVEIRNNSKDQALFALISSAFDDSATPSFANIQMSAPASSVGGAFNLLDVFSKASELVQNGGGPCSAVSSPSASPCVPPLLTAYWEPGTSIGSYYDDQQDAIFVLGGGTPDGDHDEYDDSVVAHEYGHFVARHFSHDNSPGGAHFISDNHQDIRLSFSEGWANFFSSAVRNNPLYVDTTDQSVFSFELDGLTSPEISNLPDLAVYTTAELSNSKIFWDIFDAPPADDDPLRLGFAPIFQTMIQIPASSIATMESFWLTFLRLNPSSSNTYADGLQTILKTRKIELLSDAGTSPLILNTPLHHTLYKEGPDPTGEEEIIPFNVTPGRAYTLETLNLTNGADTFLFITDATNIPISGLQNDNRNGANYQNCDTVRFIGDSGQTAGSCPPNDPTTLSSSISFTATSSSLNAHVKHALAAPPSAGLFGSYDIQLKSP